MQPADLFNGSLEIVCAMMLLMDVSAILKHQNVQGVSLTSRTFFWGWGCWNVYWYAHLDQWLSWFGAIMVMIPQTVWMGFLVYYRFRRA